MASILTLLQQSYALSSNLNTLIFAMMAVLKSSSLPASVADRKIMNFPIISLQLRYGNKIELPFVILLINSH